MWGDHNWHQRPVGSLEVMFNIWVAPKEVSGDGLSRLGTGLLGALGGWACRFGVTARSPAPTFAEPPL